VSCADMHALEHTSHPSAMASCCSCHWRILSSSSSRSTSSLRPRVLDDRAMSTMAASPDRPTPRLARVSVLPIVRACCAGPDEFCQSWQEPFARAVLGVAGDGGSQTDACQTQLPDTDRWNLHRKPDAGQPAVVQHDLQFDSRLQNPVRCQQAKAVACLVWGYASFHRALHPNSSD
jgi:hypothetical protein